MTHLIETRLHAATIRASRLRSTDPAIPRYKNILLLLIWFVLASILLYHHEPWRDEAQSWLLVTHLDLAGLLRHMPFEGTPALWHLILFPFAKMGLPYSAQSVIHLLMAFAVVSLFVLKSPFSFLTKLLFVLSYFFLFEYAVVARSYALTVLFLFLIAANDEKRLINVRRHLLFIALLAHTNIHGMILAVIFFTSYAWDVYAARISGLRNTLYFLTTLIFFLLAVLQILPGPDQIAPPLSQTLDLPAPFVAIRNAFFPGLGLMQKTVCTALGVLSLAFLLWPLWQNRRVFAVIVISIMALLAF
ncbi:MAG: hypothetical protein HQM16_08580, partial [Deltaproteobacteria bacterium]|nr:hypothetical protein [Deltaproteobacteria bacterium]